MHMPSADELQAAMESPVVPPASAEMESNTAILLKILEKVTLMEARLPAREMEQVSTGATNNAGSQVLEFE
jgi:hypothetical protein